MFYSPKRSNKCFFKLSTWGKKKRVTLWQQKNSIWLKANSLTILSTLLHEMFQDKSSVSIPSSAKWGWGFPTPQHRYTGMKQRLSTFTSSRSYHPSFQTASPVLGARRGLRSRYPCRSETVYPECPCPWFMGRLKSSNSGTCSVGYSYTNLFFSVSKTLC